MTLDPVSMTMPSVDCPTPYAPPNQRIMVMDRLRQRLNTLERHGQKCTDRYNDAQGTLRESEKRDTALLWQKMHELQNKKGGKCKMDSRQKASSTDNGDNDANQSYLARVSQSLKRKMQMASDDNQGYGEPPGGQQQESKKMKNDQSNNINNNRTQQEYPLPSVSVQIVQNFGNESAKQIETTVNVHSNRNIPDSQSVSVNVGSKHIKQEMMPQDGCQGQQQQQQQQQMNQQNINQCPGGTSESSDLDGLFEDDINMLLNWVQQMPDDVVDEINRELMTPENPQPMTSQSQPMTSQYPTHVNSQPQQMASSLHHNMASPQHHMTSPQHHMTSSQMMQQQQQNARLMCKSEKVDMFPGFYGNAPTENKQEPRGMPRQNPLGATQQNISANIMTQQSLRVGSNNFSANLSAQQNISLNLSTPVQNNFSANGRQMSTNNNNMTSQHIHRLNQVAQFAPQDAPQEPPRLFHPPASAQANYYESHSQQLKQLAEKTRYGSMSGSGSMHMIPDIRSTQPFPHYRPEVSPMTQHINMPNHPMSSGSQRLSHMDANMYSRSSQYVQSQQRPGSMNMMMQQEAIMMKQYQMQNNQHGYYNRVPEPQPQQVLPTSANMPFPTSSGPPHYSSWGQRPWPGSHNPVHRSQVTPDQMHRTQVTPDLMHRTQVTPDLMHRPQVTPEQMHRPQMNSEMNPTNSYLPELDQDLNMIEEILNKTQG